MDKLNAYITVGVSASGKSTFAKRMAEQFDYVIVNRDDLRFSLTGTKDWSEYWFNHEIEKIVTSMQEAAVVSAAHCGRGVIIADTNLRLATREKWKKFLSNFGYEVITVPFKIELDEAIRRDAARDCPIGADVIKKQWNQWLQYEKEECYGN